MSERALIRRAQAGDAAAFTDLVCLHQRGLLPLAVRLTGNDADGEEALQDALVIAFRRLSTFRGEARFSTWLYRITVRAALARRKRARRRAMPSLEEFLPRVQRRRPAQAHRRRPHRRRDDRRPRQPPRAAGRGSWPRWRACPSAIAPRWCCATCRSCRRREAAAILGIDAAALRQRVHRARLMLRGYLDTVAGRPR